MNPEKPLSHVALIKKHLYKLHPKLSEIRYSEPVEKDVEKKNRAKQTMLKEYRKIILNKDGNSDGRFTIDF